MRDSARLDNGPGTFEFDAKRARLPVIGWVKFREELRFSGKSTLHHGPSRRGSLVCVFVEVELPKPACENPAAVVIDLCVTRAATLSSGEQLPGPKALYDGDDGVDKRRSRTNANEWSR